MPDTASLFPDVLSVADADGLPDFCQQVSPLRVRDPLAELLGSATDGVLCYRYADAVRLAGHSCPTVAGAWLMVTRGLHALYGTDLPVRGEVEVSLRQAAHEGVAGVIAQVAQLLTGATTETGFKGLGGRFVRAHLLRYGDAGVQGVLALRRVDTGQRVHVGFEPGRVPWDPPEAVSELLPLALSGRGGAETAARFGQIWQDRVRRILLEHGDDAQLVPLWLEPLS